ncbi:MAG: response regulator [Candidatus Omnitrophica bacterium]|nr:response regulator [Candidatus Omnitrophota bacterium]
MIRVIVADDEPLAREALVSLLTKDSEFQVIGLAKNGAEALDQIKKLKPDVIFLDIEMPVKNGLETASDLVKAAHPPLIVFATAFHQYAVEAFEANAIDYVLKPVDPERMAKTLKRLREHFKQVKPPAQKLVALEEALIKKGLLKKIAVHKRGSKDRMVLDPAQVYYFRVHLAEVLVFVEEGELIVNAALKELLANLDPEKFVQTHKSWIVNVDKVEKVSPMFGGNFEITIRHSSHPKIPLSRRYARQLKDHLGNW